MISQADLKTIATVFGKTSEELSGALTSETEVLLDLRLNGRVISQEEERTVRESGIQQGKEIGYKEIAKSLNLDLDSGEKDPVIIAGKLNTNLAATLEEKYKNQTPTQELVDAAKKAEEWETKYKKISQTYEEANGKIESLESQYTTLQTEIKDKDLNNKILSSLPDKMKVAKDDALYITRKSLQFEENEAGLVIKRDGQIITDSVGNPEKLENVIKSFVEDKKWIGGSGVNMGGDKKSTLTPNGMTGDEAMKYIEKQGLDPMGGKGLELFSKLTSVSSE